MRSTYHWGFLFYLIILCQIAFDLHFAFALLIEKEDEATLKRRSNVKIEELVSIWEVWSHIIFRQRAFIRLELNQLSFQQNVLLSKWGASTTHRSNKFRKSSNWVGKPLRLCECDPKLRRELRDPAFTMDLLRWISWKSRRPWMKNKKSLFQRAKLF